MIRMKSVVFAGIFALVIAAVVQAFDYDSYKRTDLDEVLARPRPKTGVDVIPMEKFALSVTLESYAENCPVAEILKLTMTMLPTLYPKGFADAIATSKCIKVKSPKGATVDAVIQDKVADFLQKEVPLGMEVQVYCVLMCITAEGPGLVVTEFQVPKESKTKMSQKIGE